MSLNRSYRYAAIALLFLTVAMVFVTRLVKMQLMDYDGTYSFTRLAAAQKQVRVKGARGNICDCNGKVLVSTEEMDHMIADSRLSEKNEERNEVLQSVIGVMDSCELKYNNTWLPYQYEDGKVTIETGEMTQTDTEALAALRTAHQWEELTDDTAFFNTLCLYYGITLEDKSLSYRLMQLRYDLDANAAGGRTMYFYKNCPMELVTAIKERGLKGISFSAEMSRVYHYPGYLSQMLGRVGKIQSQDVDYYTDLGYAMDAMVGVDGLEKAFETTLCGKDGESKVTLDKEGNVLKTEVLSEPVAGQNVYLTIDIDLQIRAEDSLKANIESIAAAGQASDVAFDGEDCTAGALCVMDPNTGAVLAMASYPTFDLTTFSQDYATLSADAKTPLLNRAVQGQYAPGSTLKPGVAAAALENGIITADTLIEDKGIYTYYPDYQPKCWIYNRFHSTHGNEDVVHAISDSCNYFFFETGRRMGIDTLDSYLSALGLGQNTGIELKEATGTLAGPAERKENGENWNPGDTLQAAIGQSDHLFTPVQMASYLSTLVNGGNRYQAHLYRKSTEFYTENVTDEFTPVVLSTVSVTPQTRSLVTSGMKLLATEGNTVFLGTGLDVGCKTGTAQVGTTSSDNALFEAFCPLENPQIVAYAALENGNSGVSAGTCVRDVFTYYFENKQ